MESVTDTSLYALQLPILLRRQMDALASTCPGTHAVFKPGDRRVLGLTVRREAGRGVQGGEVVGARPGADGGPAVGLDEVTAQASR
jgi:hypothetical protein